MKLLNRRAVGYVVGILGIAAVTGICCLLRNYINEMTVALAMLLVVLFVATGWEYWPALVASVVGMLCLNYYFLPPIYSLTIEDPKNWVALSAFFITALTAGRLSAWAKQKAAEAEASRSQARLASTYNRSLLEATLDPLVTVGRDGEINDVNAAAETVTGCSRAELIGTDFHEHFTEPEKARGTYEQALRGGSVRGYPLQLLHRRGYSTSILLDTSLYRDADGNVIGVVAAARPIGSYAVKPEAVPPNPRAIRHLNLFVALASLISVSVGLLSILGLTFRIAVLKSIIPGQPVIKMNTAVCLVLLGLSLWLVRPNGARPRSRIRTLGAQIASGITALVGLLSLTEHWFGWDLGIDQLLFREPPADAYFSARPGLMAPVTALDFLLLGLAVLLLNRPISVRSRRYWPSQYFASFTAILAIVGLLDFILGSHISYTHLALGTAVTLLTVSLGLLCSRTGRGLAAMLVSSTAGGVLTRRLLPAAVAAPIVIGALSWRLLLAARHPEWSAATLMTVAMIALLAGLTIWNGYIVNRGDAERRKAEVALHHREVELREAQRLAQAGSWWWDPKIGSVTWSAGLSYLAGRDPLLPPPTYEEHLRFFTSQSSAQLDAAVQRAIRTGASFELELELVRTDGAIRFVIGRGEVERDTEGQVVRVRGTVYDITERKQAESEIQLLARLQAVIAELGQQALRSEPSDKVLQEAVTRAAQLLRVDYARVLELLPDGKTLLLRAGFGWKPGVVGHATVSAASETQAGFTLIQKAPVILEDLRTEKRFSSVPMFGDPEVVSGMSTVITTSEGPYGVFSVHTRQPRRFTQDEVNFLQSVANVLGTMIERQEAEEALRKSAEEIRDLYNHAPCGYHSLDKNGVYVQVNDTELEWLGYAREEVIGKPFAAFITPAGLKTFARSFAQVKATGLVQDFEYEMVRKDGTVLPVLLSATAVTDSAGNFLMSRSTIYDITARKKAENEIRMLANLQSVVAELGQQALRSESTSKVLENAVAVVAKTLDVEYCKVLERLPDGKSLLLRAGVGWKEGLVGHATVGTGVDSQAGFTLLSEHPVVVEDLRTEKRFSGPPLLHDHGVVSGMSVIIPTAEGPYGVMGAHTRRKRTFTKDEVNFLQAVANVLGLMIERQRADEALRKSAEEIRDLYNHAPCGYHSLDNNGVFVQINDTELSWLGYTRDEVIGKLNFAALLTPKTLRTFEDNFPKFKSTGAVQDLEFEMVRKEGTTLPVLLSATAVKDSAGNFLMSRSTIFDITARKRAENEIRMLADLQSAVADLGERALRGAPLSEVLDDATYEVIHTLDVDYCKVLELLPNRDALLLVAGKGWKPGFVGHAIVGIGRDSQAGFTLLSGEPVIVEDLKTEKRFAGTALLREHEVVSGVTVVIPTKEGPYGVLGAHSRRRRSFGSDDVNFLQAVANVLGSAIERQRAEAQLWRVNQAQRVLSKCNETLIRATEEVGLLQRICDLIVEEAGYRFCWVGSAEHDEAKSVRPLAQAGFEAGYLSTLNVTWADTERGRGPTGICIRMRKTVVMKHIASDPAMLPWRDEALKRGYASSVSIPLIFDSTVFGALMIYSAEPSAFSDDEVRLLSELASDLAFGIQTLRTRRRIQLLLDSTAEAICGLDSEGNCTWVNQSCLKMLGYANGDAMLGKNLHQLVHHSRADGTPLPQEKCPAHAALREGKFIHVDDDVMWRADGTWFPVEFWCYPMYQNGTNIGAVVTFLDIAERKRAAQLQAANQAMEQAHEREIEIGNKIQQTLLLDQPPQDIPGLRVAAMTIPSQKIDGDFYMFIRQSEQCLDVIVGDVMGKGIPAALLGAATKGHFLRALTDLSKDGKLPEPKDVVMSAHAELARHLIDLDSFVTLVYARFDESRRILELVDCGHTGTIHLHGRTGLCDVIQGENLPLGVREGEIYDQLSVPFETGDLLLFYSDGITEARNAAGALFGTDRLEERVRANRALEPGAIVEDIRNAVSAFCGSDRLVDDLTIVAVQVEGVQAPVARAEVDLNSDLKSLCRAREFVRGFCDHLPGAPIDEDCSNDLVIAVNEAASNIMKHAYHGRTDQRIHLEAEAFPSYVAVRLHHYGDPFDPSKAAPPPLDGSRDSGFGAYIISKSMDEVRYSRDDRGRNCIALIKFAKVKNGRKGNANGNTNGTVR